MLQLALKLMALLLLRANGVICDVDPLFVIDLKNPENPNILGKLKIPGYSDYLHPYDNNHIIGFGKDTVEAKEGDFAWYQGLKIAIFDVIDVNNPKELFKEIIGDRGTDSEILRNHKALLFDREKGLLSFPVTVMRVKEKGPNNAFRYGEFSFQGAYVYHVDLDNGFSLKKKITHLTDEDYLKAGSYWHAPGKSIERILYIGDRLYTLSKGKIKVYDLNTLDEIKSISLP